MHNSRLALVTLLLAGCRTASSPRSDGTVSPASELLATAATSGTANLSATQIQAILDAPDRPEDDKKLDAGRRPAEILAFFGISPGMHVAELFAASGYTTELLARAVGPAGVVYAENPSVLPAFAQVPFTARLAKPALKKVVRVDRDLDDPFPAAATDLDAVVMIMNYHDAAAIGVNRDKMNASIFAALRHDGIYAIVDHSAKAGTGITGAMSLHRIEEDTVRQEVERAGFRLDATADFLRNPSDTRDWNGAGRAAGDRRGTTDRFVLRFRKP